MRACGRYHTPHEQHILKATECRLLLLVLVLLLVLLQPRSSGSLRLL
jgi:hypothetical protein